jgi:hypothetical protein
MPVNLIVQLFYLSTFLACAFAIWKGGAPERIGAIVILAAVLAPPLAHAVLPASLLPVVDLTFDGLVGVAFLLLILRYGRVWLGVTMLLYATQFALHSFYFVTQRPADRLHAEVNNVVFLGVSITLWVGAVMAWRRQRRAAAAKT